MFVDNRPLLWYYKNMEKDYSIHFETTFETETGVYEGEIDENGLCSGYGKFTYKNGDVYEGEWLMGVREGKGKMTYSDGYYEGDWKKGVREGKGVDSFNNGYKYEGEFSCDLWHGLGKEIFPDGTYFEGEYRFGKKNGKMRHVFRGGYQESFYKDNLREGKSTAVWDNGLKMSGNYLNDKLHGECVWEKDGIKTIEHWKDGERI